MLPGWFQDLADQGIVITDADLVVRGWSRWMELYSGRRASEVIGYDLRTLYPELVARQMERYFDLALTGQVTVLAQRLHRYLLPMPSPDQAFEYMQQSVRLGPLIEGDHVTGIVVVIDDVTERVVHEQTLRQLLAQERGAREAAEATQGRLALLAEVSALLASVFNDPTALQQVARRLLPLFGDYCIIDSVDGETLVRRSALAHRDPTRETLLSTVDQSLPAFSMVPFSAETIETIADLHTVWERISEVRQQQVLQALGTRSLLIAPLIARDQQIGVLVLGSAQVDHYQVIEREFIADVAHRIASTLDSQQLYQATQEALRERDHALTIIEAERAKLHRLFTQAPAAICTMQGPDHIITFANIRYRELAGNRDLVGMRLADARPELVSQGFIELLEHVYRSGEPYVGHAMRALIDRRGDGVLEEAFFNFVYQPTREEVDGPIDGILVHSTEVTEQVWAEREREALAALVREQREHLHVTLASIGDAVIVTDMQANVTFINRVAEALIGWSEAEAIEQPIATVFAGINEGSGEPVDNPVLCIINDDTDAGITTSMLLSTRYGTQVPIDNTVAPIRDEAGRMIGVVLVFRDVSERRRAEQERTALLVRTEAARAEAEAAVRMRDVFFSVAAHELKTPLTSLIGTIQLVQRRANREQILQEREQRSFGVIENQARRLQQMIDALLDITRLEAGQLSLARVPVDLNELTLRIVQEIQLTLTKHTISYMPSEQPLIVNGDALRLEQVFQNLIQNAVKYSPRGGEIRVHASARGDDICMSVSDQGIGIPKAAIPQLFQRFYRASNVMGAQQISGIGIGLYVVREIVTLHGGTVDVDSIEGFGTTFTVCLPALNHTPEYFEMAGG